MKRIRTLFAFALALVMVFAISPIAFAEEDGDAASANPSTPSITINAKSDNSTAINDTTSYTWYRILEASIGEDPSQVGDTQSGGKVAYFVTTQDRATQLGNTGLFNITGVGTEDKWYVELKDEGTAAATIAEKFAADSFDLSKFESDTFAQTTPGGSATSGEVDPGYYYITSTAGTKTVVQTLTAVNIDEKNSFPTVVKTVADDDINAQIGDEINYTLTVNVPGTANDTIVLTDTMTDGLTFKSIDSVKSDGADVKYTKDPTEVGNAKTFTITFDKNTVETYQGKTIVISYTATLNKDALIVTGEKNTVKLKYGNSYETVPSEVTTKTYSFSFKKIDGTDKTMLTGAEFQLKRDENALSLVKVEEGKTYRIATSTDKDTTDTIVTNGNTVTINGLDSDVTYQLVETAAPTSYNRLENPIDVQASSGAFATQNVENNKGTVMPSTGGIGTTIFYVVGGVLVVGAVLFLLTKRRAAAE